MDIKVFKNKLQGSISAPPSKSMTIRAFAAAMLADGSSPIINYSGCDDAVHALEIIKNFGADVLQEDNYLIVRGIKKLKPRDVFCGESGLNSRLFGIIGLLAGDRFELTGTGSLLHRKLTDLQLLYLNLGIVCSSNGGYLPFTVEGRLKGGDYVYDGSKGSQALSGLLFALPLIENDSLIRLQNITSKPYIDMTIDLLGNFGIEFENNDYKSIFIKSKQVMHHTSLEIEGDWSNAAMVLAAGAIHGMVEVSNLNPGSFQGDRKILDVLGRCGAVVTDTGGSIAAGQGLLQPFAFDYTHCPDLFPPLIVLACFCSGESEFTGIDRLKDKESSRVSVLTDELAKMGAVFRRESDRLIIYGGTPLRGADLDSHNDHRVAMALIVSALGAGGASIVRGIECIDKSWPGFINDFGELFNNNYRIL